MKDHLWIIDVLEDMQKYTNDKHLVEVTELLVELAALALEETTARGQVGPHTSLLTDFLKRNAFKATTSLESVTVEHSTEVAILDGKACPSSRAR